MINAVKIWGKWASSVACPSVCKSSLLWVMWATQQRNYFFFLFCWHHFCMCLCVCNTLGMTTSQAAIFFFLTNPGLQKKTFQEKYLHVLNS